MVEKLKLKLQIVLRAYNLSKRLILTVFSLKKVCSQLAGLGSKSGVIAFVTLLFELTGKQQVDRDEPLR